MCYFSNSGRAIGCYQAVASLCAFIFIMKIIQVFFNELFSCHKWHVNIFNFFFLNTCFPNKFHFSVVGEMTVVGRDYAAKMTQATCCWMHYFVVLFLYFMFRFYYLVFRSLVVSTINSSTSFDNWRDRNEKSYWTELAVYCVTWREIWKLKITYGINVNPRTLSSVEDLCERGGFTLNPLHLTRVCPRRRVLVS